MLKITFKYGAYAGITMILCFLTPYFIWGRNMDLGNGELIGYACMVLCLSAVYLGIRNYRNKNLHGSISFGNAFGQGLEISGVAALIFGAYNFVLYKYLAPDLLQRLLAYSKNKIINSGQTQEIITKRLAELQSQSGFYGNPIVMGFVMVLTVFVIGIFVSLLSALVLKKMGSEAPKV